jgi:hypothetical protein
MAGSVHLFPFLSDFEVKEVDALFSDGHSLLTVEILFSCLDSQSTETDHTKTTSSQFIKPPKWRNNLSYEFVPNLDDKNLKSIELSLHELNGEISKTDINIISEKNADLFNHSAFKSFPSKPPLNDDHFSNKTSYKQKTNQWFGPQCNKASRKYNRARKMYRLHKNDLYESGLNRAAKFYKQQ